MAPVISPEERKKRIKLGIAVLVLSMPYVVWASWASGTHRLRQWPGLGRSVLPASSDAWGEVPCD